MSHTPLLVTDPFIQSELREIELHLRHLCATRETPLRQPKGRPSACRELQSALPLTVRNEILRQALGKSGTRTVEVYSVVLVQHDHATTMCNQPHDILWIEGTTYAWHEIEETEIHEHLHLQTYANDMLRIYISTKEKRVAIAPVQDSPYGVTATRTIHNEDSSTIDCVTQEGVVYAAERAKNAIASLRALL